MRHGAAGFSVEQDIDQRSVRLVLAGELDMAARAAAAAAVEAILERADRVVVDLGGITFLDSGGLDVLMSLVAELSGRDVSVAYGTRAVSVQRYLDLTRTSLDG